MIGLEFEDNLLEDRFGPENGYAIYDTGLYTVLHINLLPSSYISFEIEKDFTFLHRICNVDESKFYLNELVFCGEAFN